jgi:hypothetical protein
VGAYDGVGEIVGSAGADVVVVVGIGTVGTITAFEQPQVICKSLLAVISAHASFENNPFKPSP